MFLRQGDGEVFSLNDDGVTYSLAAMKQAFPEHKQMQWTENELKAAGMKPVQYRHISREEII